MSNGKTSKVIVIPKAWITYTEQKEERKIAAISMKISDCLILKPIFENEDDVPACRRNTPSQPNTQIKEVTAND
ncbi:MAG: hypothetical protein LBE76_08150 [Nitrososphaerota archaeon]|jgi:hypothetical protein|nr:hypothetical protein [Nitrososphaerota archaeon]